MRIPPPILLLASLVIVWFGSRTFPELNLWSDGALPWLALLPLSAAIILEASANVNFFTKKTTVNPIRIENASSLVTGGVFAYTRNPMYLGIMLIVAAAGIYTGFWPSLVVMIVLWAWLTRFQILPEEEVLAEKFGQEFLDYKARVRRWI